MVEARRVGVNDETAVSVKFSFRLGTAADIGVEHTVEYRPIRQLRLFWRSLLLATEFP